MDDLAHSSNAFGIFERETVAPGTIAGTIASESADADIILITHPYGERLGSRFRLSPGTNIEIGRSQAVTISLPEVKSISRKHARLRYVGPVVTIEDLGSTNGTYINGQPLHGRTVVKSGDRFQTADVHFKFIHEKGSENAYHMAIYEMISLDALTEVYSKWRFEDELQREFARSVRHSRPLSLIIFDVDGLKHINETYGRRCGDFALKQVAAELKYLLRPEQMLARIGGDEFAILSPETTAIQANMLALKLLNLVRDLDYRHGDLHVPLSFSFGVAQLNERMRDSHDLYRAADHTLLLFEE